ncbi:MULTISPECIES: glycosyltransferase family 2 protein [Weeksella]|uniref:Glycosyl transferase family 2 n=1 Tax=Weeksella virosa (strain ATCC 43766 / DSM 16922 / JCM 21250 / CCUG 30538 / CDC 9751 / IAM 14551 / NBRC 16016 / NCTC 11634 / CL345/78) TaxID=865938 RepID=F0P1D6_WEEVC|nr:MULTISPECIES: glycosyltransferase family 2 protein [Weeksella]ADX68650.1 glycosyl transferase family 2 [Weeksella virosa DSM 16922]MDK7375926.1 glycosyltransferase family 2 protein [Weeksella virosa]MDK7675789.1 glycosyltransferase family 2 protein [Weeksella virosa]OFM85284.1 glycosyl transferase family 2 [Weeksella sp. HMSC059D05]SUP54997.1 Hyaluronan synthase [Weeksella virosa]
MKKFSTSVIISTYNQPLWLEKVLLGYMQQDFRDFEVIIADDGSTEETRKLINKYRNKTFFPIKHVWQEDLGFRKTIILNKAILSSNSDYLIFTDGDCIPRKDFITTHIAYRTHKHYLSGGYIKLSREVSNAIEKSDIENQLCFDKNWLIEKGQKNNFKLTKLHRSTLLKSIMNRITTTAPTWNGHNSSGWKKDILEVNGFDERMVYGGEDRELGERLCNNGIRAKQIRFSAICIHLDHDRNYVKRAGLKQNNNIREITVSEKITWTDHGIKEKS